MRKKPHFTLFKTRLGWMGLSVTPRGVHQITCPQRNRKRAVQQLSMGNPGPAYDSSSELRAIRRCLLLAKRQVVEYCSGKRRTFHLPLDFHRQGTEFQRRVWQETLKIPYGRTSTYLEIAEGVGRHSLSRAVGNALGANPLPLIIPCHRVVASDGKLGGYSGGLDVKRDLLRLEGIRIPLGPKK